MPAKKRFRLSTAPPVLHWDGQALRGETAAKVVDVALPARFVSFRREEFPPAAEALLKSAIRLRAERAFLALGPVAIDMLLGPVRDGRRVALLMALPRPTIAAIQAAAKAQGRTVAAVRIAELLMEVPHGGVVRCGGEACLVALDGAIAREVVALGRGDAADLPVRLARERLRTGVGEDQPAAPALGAALDFLAPTLSAAQPLLQRPAMRVAILAATLVGLFVLWGALAISDTLEARTAAVAEAAKLRPLAKALADKRADMKEVASWLEARPSLAPGLDALALALPGEGSDDQVRLARVRQTPGEEAIAEGQAGDRAQMMGFLGRLRKDQRIAFAEIRASRSPSKESRAVVFELVFRLVEPGGAAVTPLKPAAHAGASTDVRKSGSPGVGMTGGRTVTVGDPSISRLGPGSYQVIHRDFRTSGLPDLRTLSLAQGGDHASS